MFKVVYTPLILFPESFWHTYFILNGFFLLFFEEMTQELVNTFLLKVPHVIFVKLFDYSKVSSLIHVWYFLVLVERSLLVLVLPRKLMQRLQHLQHRRSASLILKPAWWDICVVMSDLESIIKSLSSTSWTNFLGHRAGWYFNIYVTYAGCRTRDLPIYQSI